MNPTEDFQRLQAEHIAALNGIGRNKAGAAELSILNDRLMAAKKACLEAGIEVEDIWTSIQRRRAVDEAELRTYAAEEMKVVPLVPRARRTHIALSAAFPVLTVSLALTEFSRFFWPIVGALFAYVVFEAWLGELFPTPAIRIGRAAAKKGIDVSNLWPAKSGEYGDYGVGYKMQQFRMRRKRELDMIRVR